ncbi:3-phosphoshikimate 1-carboxyvinyltransferase [Actinotignum sp. GS-2025b]|uniref:3-phosphoshikimate 1-carboxyvinyltransferase n=1 Tax=Actinotignum sp. GS-2025b TaxID=3427275 RepID=UPI003F463B6F
MTDLWPAPFHPSPVRGSVAVPGSKSLMARFLITAALGGPGTTGRILAPLRARDTELMARALASMGVGVAWQRGTTEAEDVLDISPAPLHGATIDAGLAGTVMRFVPPVAAFARGEVVIDGDDAARVRPMDPVVRALRDLGVEVDAASDSAGRAVLPVRVHGQGRLAGGTVNIDSSASSQFISALLLAGPRCEGGLVLRSVGPKVPSAFHLAMTVDVLRRAGIQVEEFAAGGAPADREHPAVEWHVHPGTPQLGTVVLEPDLSNASPFLAAAMVTGGTVEIPRWSAHTTQPGAQIVDIFTAMGARAQLRGDGVLELTGPQDIAPLDADLSDVGELTPTIAAVAAFATGPSALRNIGQLRGHETNRLAAITAELSGVGIPAREEGDDIIITPPAGQGAAAGGTSASAQPAAPAPNNPVIRSYEDHRMATFGAILGLRIPGLRVENIATTGKTMPRFAQMWTDLVGR